ncbi:MAG TPA: hypothetical protein PLG31_13450 [Spirochaetota bacterium]|nr:hypothetical protein [Spirochaetota bacterium]HPU88292.1 hypothetical protein [Spirochaetota bacterium]
MQRLISEKLVGLIEKNSASILEKWVERLLADGITSSFSKGHVEYVSDKAKGLLQNLGKWLHYDTNKDEIEKRYTDEAKDLFKMKIPLHEATRAMVVLRRFVWLFVVDETSSDSAFELNQLKEFNDRLILFFDRAQYYVIRSYMAELSATLQQACKVSADDAEKLFFTKSFYNK